MNSRTVTAIVAFAGMAVFALMIAAMMFTSRLAEKPLVRVSLAVAQKHEVTEVTCDVQPGDKSRTLKVGYTTSVSVPNPVDEMERIAQFALAEVDRVEKETLRRDERASRGPIRKVAIVRTWRTERGCFKRSSMATHEWIPPEAPPERSFRG